mgnify:CR=1 FL=1
MLFDPKGCGCLTFILAMLGLTVIGAVGLVNFARESLPIIVPRITDNIPYIQERMFSESTDQYPVLAEAPKEVRVGTEFTLTIRGAEYQNITEPLTMTFKFSTDNLNLVRAINPVITHTVAHGDAWLLGPHEVKVSTINTQSPPESFAINVVQTITNKEGATVEHPPEMITISIDPTPVPTIQIAKAMKSLLAFLIGTFGVFIASKLF